MSLNTSVCTTAEELYSFLMEAELQFGDPARSVGLLVVPWRDMSPGQDLVCATRSLDLP